MYASLHVGCVLELVKSKRVFVDDPTVVADILNNFFYFIIYLQCFKLVVSNYKSLVLKMEMVSLDIIVPLWPFKTK